MNVCDDDKCEKGVQAMTRTKKFSKLLHELEHRTEDEKKQKIEEMNGLIDEMEKKEFKSVFTEELFDKIHQMIEKKTLSLESAILLLKHVGYYRELKIIYLESFDDSLLSDSMKEMIIDENEKTKDEKDEMLLIELCECFAWLNEDFISKELFSVIMPRLLKVALKKEENEETQKEVEMALLALNHISKFCEIKQELYLNGITEIIKYHQEHHNLTQLSYQSAWQFLINRFYNDKSLEEVIVNELHFAREATRELEELTRCIDWKKKEEENERIEVSILRRWLNVIDNYFSSCELWKEEIAGLLYSFVQACSRK
ncbi:uncharacterized protein MONOS_13272 [Monocercomonoides exilis]|uniref:uncharacterized protein n=1 Tax=Monocercomonoides exilis TaxID=2049356 RepID=UPI00355AB434|nr:hypothetical protein MONOS_13272 [Monocercomonoides exilis]|eukprot:MONOS_13272.1-p1 / transcript=MONOS_13272.1 / gene=MONOS_13272 / organism=Monocercomonoides_exilis_PA203 / gene_product=unspecified product / transcript_product=unspecified product / location=Mono_scaffold00801:21420-22549(+) / protein_length=314 / sequence_SO=supercontig / SO=protein_coding / is_pseudo=false